MVWHAIAHLVFQDRDGLEVVAAAIDVNLREGTTTGRHLRTEALAAEILSPRRAGGVPART